jgi:serine/threonine-protein kinase
MSDATGRWARIAALFDELVELDDAGRERRIDSIAHDDAALADELRSLLAADAAGGALLESDAAAALPGILIPSDDVRSDDVWTSETAHGEMPPPDSRVGLWRLVRPIGEGGMGVVWLAERADGAFEQHVAVKVLKRGMDTHAILRRFLQERRILARLHQPHIVRLVDGGMTADGRPFYVMDFVDGEPITQHAASRALDVRARVALMIDVAEAVAYAHAQLVVHRDLKPSNVLVDHTGAPRVLDFGIAKLIEDSGEATMTGTGMRVLSPAYAAPEQILGEAIGTATDIHALGLMLCELLTGQLPRKRRTALAAHRADDADYEATERASALAAQADDARMREMYGADGDARRLARTLSGDLDVVIATALQREPARRYATAAAFADDLRRWLDGRPIAARADTAGYRLRKFVRRHRIGVAASVLVALALIAGLGSALWQARIARAQAERADLERTHSERQLARTQRVKEFMLTLFREQDPMSRAKAQARTAGELIRDGIAEVDTTFTDQPELHAELLQDLGEIQTSLGDVDAAKGVLERARDERKKLSGADSAAGADADAVYAAALLAAGDTDTAEKLLRPALARLRQAFGPDHPKTIEAENSLARIEIYRGHYDAGLALSRHGVKAYSASHGAESPEVAVRLSALASMQLQATQYDEALASSREALRIIEHSNGPDHVRAILPHTQISDVLRYRRDYPGALAELETAVRIGRAQLPPRHPKLAAMLIRLGDLLRRMKRYDDAEKVFEEGIGMLAGSNTGEYAQMLQGYGELAFQQGHFDLAAKRYRESFARFRAATGESVYTWITALVLGETLIAQHRLDQAEKVVLEARAGIARIATPDSYDAGFADGVLAHLRFRQGRVDESIAAYRHALAVMTSIYGAQHAEVASLRFMLARSLAATGEEAGRSEAAALLAQALPIIERDDPAGQMGEVHLLRAELRLQQGDRAGARADVAAALPLLGGFGIDQDTARKHARALGARLGVGNKTM